jgi:acyl-CoA reductase-like NAD-dependent aldehyde dehydrogenase
VTAGVSPRVADTITVHNPRDGRVVGEVAVTRPQLVVAAADRARAAFAEWGRLTHAERRPHLRAYTRTVLRRMDHIAETICSETGKHAGDAMAEVAAALTAMDFTARHAIKLLRPKRGGSWPFPSTRGWMEFHPIGVAGVISPANYPFYLTMLATIQALGAGCTVVVKPSELTPRSGALVASLATEAGLPDGVVTVVYGYGDTGAALVEAVDVVAFTGSTETGKRVAAQAAETLKPVVLELGGKDAMIVLEDAHVRDAARAAVTFGMFNAGQTCTAVERVYVVDEVYDEFVAEALRATEKLNAGDGDGADIGPVIDPAQIAVVEAHMADAINKGATVLQGGARRDTGFGVFYEPTLLVDVDHTMQLMRDETFGPVLPVMRVPDEAAAVRMANDSRYGLHGSVWSKDKRRAERVASAMSTGTVAINDHMVNFFFPSIRLGGINDSGTGGLLGEDGLKAFCHHKSITQARMMPTTKLMGGWLPRRVGPRYWKVLARALFAWRR